MTDEQEKAKELAKLLNAFADGKQLQVKSGSQWYDYSPNVMESFIEDFCNPMYGFRIKPEIKRIALTMQDLIDRELIGKTMRLSNSELILSWNHNFVTTVNNTYGYSYLLDNEFTFLDGTHCYKEVECE